MKAKFPFDFPRGQTAPCIALAVLATACFATACETKEPGGGPLFADAVVDNDSKVAELTPKLDILWVIDHSSSMC